MVDIAETTAAETGGPANGDSDTFCEWKYLIHYPGWKKRFDEWISPKKAADSEIEKASAKNCSCLQFSSLHTFSCTCLCTVISELLVLLSTKGYTLWMIRADRSGWLCKNDSRPEMQRSTNESRMASQSSKSRLAHHVACYQPLGRWLHISRYHRQLHHHGRSAHPFIYMCCLHSLGLRS